MQYFISKKELYYHYRALRIVCNYFDVRTRMSTHIGKKRTFK